MPDIGKKAPAFTLLNQRGEKVNLNDYKGRKVVLFAFPKANTGGCNDQACGFSEAMPEIDAGGAVVLGISPDSPEKLASWQERKQLGFDLLSDPDHAVLEKWGAWGEKKLYGKTYQGVIRSHWVIDENGRITDQQIKVSPAKSVELATAFLVDR
ncbi:thioredoxin-dependent thiol peroxidase [bacterium]|nr:thioredoxin-dependent thiol peroxidase [bacterium]